jgi:hypothetical protein
MLKKLALMIVSAYMFAVTPASAGLTTFTNEGTFNTAIGGTSLTVEGFETLTLGLASGPYVSGGVSMNTTSGDTFGNTSVNLVTEGARAENWQQNADGDITFTFAAGIDAFGIDITDFGYPSTNTMNVSVNGGTFFDMFAGHSGGVGNLLFLGLYNDMTAFTTVTFSDTASSADGIGLDRLQYGMVDVPQVPVPAAIWLFGTALIGLVGFSKRRKVA